MIESPLSLPRDRTTRTAVLPTRRGRLARHAGERPPAAPAMRMIAAQPTSTTPLLLDATADLYSVLELGRVIECIGRWTQRLLHADECHVHLGAPHASTTPVNGGSLDRPEEDSGRSEEADREASARADDASATSATRLYITMQVDGVHVGLIVARRDPRRGALSRNERRVAERWGEIAARALRHARAADEMRRVGRAESELAATLLHELRSPLHVLRGFHSLLREQVDASDDLWREALGGIGRSSQRLVEIVENVLHLDRARAPGAARLEPIDLEALLTDIREEADDLRRGSRVALDWQSPGDLPHIAGHSTYLRIVLRNLLSNAFKYTDDGIVSLRVRTTESHVEIEIRDTGIGIPANALAQIFAPFQQAVPGGVRERGGVGLGLHIARWMVEAMGGRIDAASTLGEGSSFRVRLLRA